MNASLLSEASRPQSDAWLSPEWYSRDLYDPFEPWLRARTRIRVVVFASVIFPEGIFNTAAMTRSKLGGGGRSHLLTSEARTRPPAK